MVPRNIESTALRRHLLSTGLGLVALFGMTAAHPRQESELQDALQLKPDLEHGRLLYDNCATCHQSHGGGEPNRAIPSIAGQHYEVVIEQLANFRGETRWDLRMVAFTAEHRLEGPQELADVAAYIAASRRDRTQRSVPAIESLSAGRSTAGFAPDATAPAERVMDRSAIPG